MTDHRAHAGTPPATPTACRSACAPSPTGCLRCEAVPGTTAGTEPALLLGPRDADAANRLRQVLSDANFAFAATGPVLVVTGIRGRLAEVEALFKAKLSPITQASVAASYVRGGLATAEQMMAALLVARPLNEWVDHLAHEWAREALADNWLFSVFHPILDARSGSLFAQEALIRARDPHTGKVMGAGPLIVACEKLNLQHQLDQRARQAAIYGAAEHVPAPAKVFINFLPNTIYDPAICLRTTMEAAAQSGVPMSRLVFEVVETEKIPDMAHLRHILGYYRERGVGTAIDDMGAGHTGLDYITELKPDFVKLDREFVLEAERTAEGKARMDAIIQASHDHGARVIAEGIETEAQMKLCSASGVDLLQGFLFAKPACPPQAASFPTARRMAA
ncbi:MAG: hypothetical protein JWO31_3951 [Phycisphaerales bacterium]|nr:hypothetical protein [Phycisphaerales bacterium]